MRNSKQHSSKICVCYLCHLSTIVFNFIFEAFSSRSKHLLFLSLDTNLLLWIHTKDEQLMGAFTCEMRVAASVSQPASFHPFLVRALRETIQL
jgi:hypothetical protein